jgi:N-methylhydantoinase A
MNADETIGLVLGVDVGGTFTDFVVADQAGVRIHKVPSTPADPSRAILRGLAELALPPAARIVHGSTVATNALLERKGAVTAFLTTHGFRDLLEIGRQTRLGLYSLSPTKPEPLVPRGRCFDIPERIGKDGEVLTPLDEEAARRAVDAAVAAGAESIAITFLFSFVRPEHERHVRDLAAARGLYVSASCDILPEYREYERASTTTINAYVGPVMTRYLSRLVTALETKGEGRWAMGERGTGDGDPPNTGLLALRPSPVALRLQIMQSNGGVISAEVAGREAVRTILSGPAGGVIGAARVARAAGFERIVGLDMGGTSTDVALVQGEPRTSSEGQIAGLPVRVPMLDIHTVGAGGGSIARVDAGGGLRVGPESAGAEPGPAAYGVGEQPTVTDANLILGRLHAPDFLGGRMSLYPERAAAALDRLAAGLGLERIVAAAGVIRVVNAQMARAIRRVSVERGHDVRDFCLVAFGGGGPLHACDLAELTGMSAVLVPRYPGTLSALGLILSDILKEYTHTVMAPTAALVPAELGRHFAAMEQRARADLAAEAVSPDAMRLSRWLEMRYRGQSYELTVPAGDLAPERFTAAFHEAHRTAYGHANPAEPTEVVLLRVRAAGETGVQVFRCSGVQGEGRRRDARRAPARGTQAIYFDQWIETPIFARGDLRPGHTLMGPALVTQEDSTTLVAPGWVGRVDAELNLVLGRT